MIDIDEVWQELGYARKDYLVKYVLSHFTEGEHYQQGAKERTHGGRPPVVSFITLECYEMIKSRRHHQTKNVYREKVHRAILHSKIGGKKEVQTPVGCIDILTEEEIVEVKRVKDWRTGLGQLLAYAYFYRRKAKQLHLFGECSTDERELIQKVCGKYRVKVTWAEN